MPSFPSSRASCTGKSHQQASGVASVVFASCARVVTPALTSPCQYDFDVQGRAAQAGATGSEEQGGQAALGPRPAALGSSPGGNELGSRPRQTGVGFCRCAATRLSHKNLVTFALCFSHSHGTTTTSAAAAAAAAACAAAATTAAATTTYHPLPAQLRPECPGSHHLPRRGGGRRPEDCGPHRVRGRPVPGALPPAGPPARRARHRSAHPAG